MRNKIFGGIGVLWGGFILVRWIISGAQMPADLAGAAGLLAALILGALMLIAGFYYFFKKPISKKSADNR